MAKLKDMDVPIEGMHCASCVLSVNKTFEREEGVEAVDADLASNKLHITVNPKKMTYDEMDSIVKNLGFELHCDEVTLRIDGMHCASCTMNVENFLIRLDGIFDVKADLTSGTARIRYDKSKVTIDDMEAVINNLGFELLGIDGQTEIDEEELYQQDLKSKRNRIIVGLFFSAILMILMYSMWDPLMGLTHQIHESTGIDISSMGLLSLLISIFPFLYVSLPILKAGINGLMHKNLNMDVMYSMGIIVAYGSSILGTFGIVLDHTFMFYDSAVMLPSFLMIGRYLEARAKKRTSDSIRELIGLQPTVATAIELDENNEIDDLVLYALGLIPSEDIDMLSNAAVNGTKLEEKEDRKWSYEEICKTQYKVILNSNCYRYDETTGNYIDLRDSDAGLRYLYDNALALKVTGIIKPNPDADATMLKGKIAYTNDLTKFIIEKADDSDVVKAQLNSPNIDILSGLPFESTTSTLTDIEKEKSFREYIDSLTDAEKATAYIDIKSIPSAEFVNEQINNTFASMTRADMEKMMLEGITDEVNISVEEITEYLAAMSDEEFNEMFTGLLTERIKESYANNVKNQFSSMNPQQILFALNSELPNYTTEQCAIYYDEVIDFSESSYEQNLIDMGCVSLDDPATINIYASSFENKDIAFS